MVDGTGGIFSHGGSGGRGNLRVAKTPPLQSRVSGISMRDAALQTPLRRFLNRDAMRCATSLQTHAQTPHCA